METPFAILNNDKQQQFQVMESDDLAYLEYRWLHKDLALMHTYVPESLAGKGLASALAQYAFEYAKENNLKVIVYCPFVAAYLKRHPVYNFLVKTQGE